MEHKIKQMTGSANKNQQISKEAVKKLGESLKNRHFNLIIPQ